MTAHIAAYGRLVADPERHETRTGKPWGTVRLAVTLPKPYGADDDGDPPTLWLGVTVFGERIAEELARHRKGDSLSVAGRLELRTWTGREGERREGWTCIADSLIGPRTGRPGGDRTGDGSPARNGRGDGSRRPAPAPSHGPMPDDEIPL